MSPERELGPRARTVEGLSDTLGIDASGQVLTSTPSDLLDTLTEAKGKPTGEIDFVFSPPRGNKQVQERIFDELAELRMAGGE